MVRIDSSPGVSKTQVQNIHGSQPKKHVHTKPTRISLATIFAMKLTTEKITGFRQNKNQ